VLDKRKRGSKHNYMLGGVTGVLDRNGRVRKLFKLRID